MRKILLICTSVLAAIALLLSGSPAAGALGSETIGCYESGSSWTANACTADSHTMVTFEVHNLIGSYSYSWSVATGANAPITASCTGPVGTNGPCVLSGCTATSSYCSLELTAALTNRVWTATVQLSQGSNTRTLQAQATVLGAGSPCPSRPCP